AVYLVALHRAETALAGSLLRLLHERTDRMPHFAAVDWNKALAWLHTRTGTTLAAEQDQAVRLALTSKVAILTAGPGCGKSFTVRSTLPPPAPKTPKSPPSPPPGRPANRPPSLTGPPPPPGPRRLHL